MGAWTHDQYRSRPRRPQGRQPDMGRSVQYLLLDRPDDADRRRDHDADPPLRRPASAQDLSTIRARNLSRGWVSLKIVHRPTMRVVSAAPWPWRRRSTPRALGR